MKTSIDENACENIALKYQPFRLGKRLRGKSQLVLTGGPFSN